MKKTNQQINIPVAGPSEKQKRGGKFSMHLGLKAQDFPRNKLCY